MEHLERIFMNLNTYYNYGVNDERAQETPRIWPQWTFQFNIYFLYSFLLLRSSPLREKDWGHWRDLSQQCQGRKHFCRGCHGDFYIVLKQDDDMFYSEIEINLFWRPWTCSWALLAWGRSHLSSSWETFWFWTPDDTRCSEGSSNHHPSSHSQTSFLWRT